MTGLSKVFSGMTPRAQSLLKNDKLGLIKILNFCSLIGTVGPLTMLLTGSADSGETTYNETSFTRG